MKRYSEKVRDYFSLPTQRCFLLSAVWARPSCLFSAYAEVFPRLFRSLADSGTFLCLRRGVSGWLWPCSRQSHFSLPTQRCFPLRRCFSTKLVLFSAYAEVFPITSLDSATTEAFLCLRRGVSCPEPPASTPLPLFSAYAEVFLFVRMPILTTVSFLCLRRGVSKTLSATPRSRTFSLPTQRCFCRHHWPWNRGPLFSAYAEVFPLYRSGRVALRSFLCLRRGVSSRSSIRPRLTVFSLPTQRCFTVSKVRIGVQHLFSAYAEVFLYAGQSSASSWPFLCLRRGVSNQKLTAAKESTFSLPTQRCF